MRCSSCEAEGPYDDSETETKAIDLWNTRTGTVYNGKTAEEWYQMYVASVIRGKPLAVLAEDSLEQPYPPPSEAPEA